jgi:hypothetical protein
MKTIPVFIVIAALLVMITALCLKGDVKAGLKMLGVEFTIDAKDHKR